MPTETNPLHPTMTFESDVRPWLFECLAVFEAKYGPGEINLELSSDLKLVAVIQPKQGDQ